MVGLLYASSGILAIYLFGSTIQSSVLDNIAAE